MSDQASKWASGVRVYRNSLGKKQRKETGCELKSPQNESVWKDVLRTVLVDPGSRMMCGELSIISASKTLDLVMGQEKFFWSEEKIDLLSHVVSKNVEDAAGQCRHFSRNKCGSFARQQWHHHHWAIACSLGLVPSLLFIVKVTKQKWFHAGTRSSWSEI